MRWLEDSIMHVEHIYGLVLSALASLLHCLHMLQYGFYIWSVNFCSRHKQNSITAPTHITYLTQDADSSHHMDNLSLLVSMFVSTWSSRECENIAELIAIAILQACVLYAFWRFPKISINLSIAPSRSLRSLMLSSLAVRVRTQVRALQCWLCCDCELLKLPLKYNIIETVIERWRYLVTVAGTDSFTFDVINPDIVLLSRLTHY